MKVRRHLRDFKRSTLNIIKWFPVIWTDRQWDYIYFLKIIRFKLIQMEKFFLSPEAVSENAENESKDMRRCIDAIDRLIDDYPDLFTGDIKTDPISIWEMHDKLTTADLTLICDLIKERLFHWWD